MKPVPEKTRLQAINVASPCPSSWEGMEGNDRQRFCSQCQLHVFNLSDMTTAEAEGFLAERAAGERTCVRYYRRQDGTVLTTDCPVGLRQVRRRLRMRFAQAAAGCIAFLCSGVALVAAGTKLGKWAEEKGEYARLGEPAGPEVVIGAFCFPAPAVPAGDSASANLSPPATPDGSEVEIFTWDPSTEP